MIAVDPVFNEMSLSPPAADEQQACARMARAIEILTQMPNHGLGKSLRISTQFYLLELATGYTVTRWVNDHRVDRDQLNFFLGLAAKAPFLQEGDGTALDCLDDTEVAFEGQAHPAFLAAYALDAPMVSLDHGPWSQPDLPATVNLLDGEGELTEEHILLVNFAHSAHFDEHAPWFARRNAVIDAADMWERREELFPHLVFWDSVEAQLVQQTPILSMIAARLEDIERVAALGQPFDKNAFHWKCNATSAATFDSFREYYEFCARDGSVKRCGWHFYLPDGRRIYFSGDYTIGYVGLHLPTVKFH